MKTLRIKKGFDLNVAGRPSKEVEKIPSGDRLAVLPYRIPFVKPRLLVKEGDTVKIGSVLYEDKRNTDVKFLSPGSGTILQVKFGRRRVIQEIIVELDSQESFRNFEKFTPQDVDRVDKKTLIRAVLAGGLWSLFKAFPFGDLPQPEDTPPAIIVNLDSKEPFYPSADVYLKENITLFNLGLKILGRLSDQVFLSVIEENARITERLKGQVTHQVQGPYPAGDPGVLLYHIKKRPEENRSWTISGQDLLLLASLISNGIYPTERIIAVGGKAAGGAKHMVVRLGVQLSELLKGSIDETGATRYIAGGIFTGHELPFNSFMSLRDTSLAVLPQGREKEFFGFARPGYAKTSYSKTFLSRFRTVPLDIDCGLHGEERACINCGYCAEVCAVDILPQFALKAALAGEVEETLSHGLLDCVSCGLCTYVCPSKIDICNILKKAKTDYYHEIHS